MKTIEVYDLNSLQLILNEIEKANLVDELTVLSSGYYLVSDEAAEKLTALLPYADWTIEEYKVEGYPQAKVRDDNESWYINLNTGLGEAEYPKEQFTLDEAVADQVNWKVE